MQYSNTNTQFDNYVNSKQCGYTDIFHTFIESFYSDVFGPASDSTYEHICASYSQYSTRSICNEYLNTVDTVEGHIGIFEQINTPSTCIAPLNYTIKNISVIPTSTIVQSTIMLHIFVTGTAVQIVNTGQSFTQDTDFPYTHSIIMTLDISDNTHLTSAQIITELLQVQVSHLCKCNEQGSHVYNIEDSNAGNLSLFEHTCLFTQTPSSSSTLTPLSVDKIYRHDIWSTMGSPGTDAPSSDNKSRFDDIFRLHGCWNSSTSSPFVPVFDNEVPNDITCKFKDGANVDSVFDTSVLKCIESIQTDYSIQSSIDLTAPSTFPHSVTRVQSPFTCETTTPIGSMSRPSPISTNSKLSAEPIRSPPGLSNYIEAPYIITTDNAVPQTPQSTTSIYEGKFSYPIDKNTIHEDDTQQVQADELLSVPSSNNSATCHRLKIGQSKRKKQNQLAGKEKNAHVCISYNENINASNGGSQKQNLSAKHGPPLWGLLEGERDRMVYVSWVPRVARADEVSKKNKCVMQLRWFIVSYLGFTGLEKVLLYPPSSAHCKLLFDTEETAKRFLTQFGGTMEQSAGPQRWKEAICKYYKVDILDGIKGTKVKIIWADASKEPIPRKESA